MIYLAYCAYVLLLILCISLCKISSESDEAAQNHYEDIMSRKRLSVHYDANEEEWDAFLRDLEKFILNGHDQEEIEKPFNLYESISQEHQDQS